MAMTTEAAKILLNALQLAPRYLVALGSVSAFLLFSPHPWLQSFGLADFAKDYRPWISLAFLTSCALCSGSALILGWKWIQNLRRKRDRTIRTIQRLKTLTEKEKQVLWVYIVSNRKTNVLRSKNGILYGLISDGVISRVENQGSDLEGYMFVMSDAAWNYLSKHPELLLGTTAVGAHVCDAKQKPPKFT